MLLCYSLSPISNLSEENTIDLDITEAEDMFSFYPLTTNNLHTTA